MSRYRGPQNKTQHLPQVDFRDRHWCSRASIHSTARLAGDHLPRFSEIPRASGDSPRTTSVMSPVRLTHRPDDLSLALFSGLNQTPSVPTKAGLWRPLPPPHSPLPPSSSFSPGLQPSRALGRHLNKHSCFIPWGLWTHSVLPGMPFPCLAHLAVGSYPLVKSSLMSQPQHQYP